MPLKKRKSCIIIACAYAPTEAQGVVSVCLPAVKGVINALRVASEPSCSNVDSSEALLIATSIVIATGACSGGHAYALKGTAGVPRPRPVGLQARPGVSLLGLEVRWHVRASHSSASVYSV